jgi:EpsI family protein
MRFDFRLAITVILLFSTGVFLQSRKMVEVLPPRQPLASLPYDLGVWRGVDAPISRNVLDVLGQGDFLSRMYQDTSSDQSFVDLFIAYFPSQRTGDTIHSPANCLPGSGWFPLESGRITLALPGHVPFPANRYLVAKGNDRDLVLYWYWSHDRAVASEYSAKFYLVADALRLNRSDGAMIRVITPLRGESVDTAQRRLVSFVGEVVPRINSYAPP